ncbi:MAG: hypothetical protein KGZ94_00320 [Clostridia bacterium]|nr:hypothetical protein [Clostridia bacterium]
MNKAEPGILGVDIGTSSLKAVLYSLTGIIMGIAKEKYYYQTPYPGWAEINPEIWWQAFKNSLKALSKMGLDLKQIKALAFTGQMHTAILLDKNDGLLSPTIMWLDRRAVVETEELAARLKLPPYQLNSTYTISKLLWLRKNRPEIILKADRVLWPKDYLRWKLTGEYCTDTTDALGSGLYDWDKETWSLERINLVGFDPRVLPGIKVAGDNGGDVLKTTAKELGLNEKVKVIVGMGDMAALIGGAPLKPGRVVCSIGSSSMIFTPIDSNLRVDAPDQSLYSLKLGSYHLFGGVSSTTGAAILWFYENILSALQNKLSFNDWIQEVLTIDPGADGICFIPYLAGERSPYWNDDIRGGFYGLKLSHDKRHLGRAVLEGVAYSLKHILELFEQSGMKVEELVLAAGGIRTPGLLQIIADVCEKDVLVYAGEETVTRVLYALCKEHLALGNFENNLVATFNEPEKVSFKMQNQACYQKTYVNYKKFSKFASCLK